MQNSIYPFLPPNTACWKNSLWEIWFHASLGLPYHRLHRTCSPSSCLCRTLWDSSLWRFLQRWHRISYATFSSRDVLAWAGRIIWEAVWIKLQWKVYLLDSQPWNSPFSLPPSASVSVCNSLQLEGWNEYFYGKYWNYIFLSLLVRFSSWEEKKKVRGVGVGGSPMWPQAIN